MVKHAASLQWWAYTEAIQPNKTWRGEWPLCWLDVGMVPYAPTVGLSSSNTPDPSQPQLLLAQPSVLPLHSTLMSTIIVLEVMAVKINSTHKA